MRNPMQSLPYLPFRSLSIVLCAALFFTSARFGGGETHYIDLQYGINNASFFENGILKIKKGGGLTLLATDSSGHLCSILGLPGLNPQYTYSPIGIGSAITNPPVICTELGDHPVRGYCWANPQSPQYVELTVRVMEGQLYADTWYKRTVEILQGDTACFWTLDYLNHWCYIFGFNQLNDDPYYQTWVPQGWGYAWGEPVCTIPGNFTIYGFCAPSGVYDQVVAKVKPANITPDEGQLGFHQTWVNGEVEIQVTVQGGHYCRILGLNQLNPDYNEDPDGYGSCYAPVTCTVKGDHTIWGVDWETWDVDYTVIRVSEIVETRWEQIAGPLGDNPNAGGGKRIFPDWQLSDFPNGPYPPRSWVQVHAIVDPPPADPNQPLRVRFMPYDVDDPSANQPPVDDERMFTDNRGGSQWVLPSEDGGWSVYIPVTTAGHAATVLQVSTQPGDNFRVNAQIDPILYTCVAHQGVGDGHLDIAGTGQPVPAGEVTPMLTVWRKVHIETDQLAQPYQQQWNPTWAEGTIWDATYFPAEDQTALAVDKASGPSDLYTSGGLLAGGQFGAWHVISSRYIDDSGSHIFVGGDHTDAQSAGYQMADDDHDYTQIQPLFPLKVKFPLTPDTSYLATVFKPAYIEPEFNELAPYNTTILFWGTEWNIDLPGFRGYAGTYCGSRALGRDMYWCAYLLGAFQPGEAEDGDPNSERFCMGFTDPDYNRGAVVFQETYRDLQVWMAGTGKTLKPFSWIVAHEMGHQFTLCHTMGYYKEAPNHVGWVVERNGMILTLDRQLDLVGFNYVGAMLITLPGQTGDEEHPLSESRIVSYSNDPGSNRCMVLVTVVSGTPAAGQYFMIYENSIMIKRASYLNQGVFSPRDLSDLRTNTKSPIRVSP